MNALTTWLILIFVLLSMAFGYLMNMTKMQLAVLTEIKDLLKGLRADIEDWQAEMLPESASALRKNSHYIATERQKERTRQFLEERERRLDKGQQTGKATHN